MPASGRSFLGALAQADRDALLARARHRRWERGERLVREGEHVDSAIVLLSGLVKIGKLAADGTEAVLAVSGPGELLGEISAVRDARRSADVTALEPVEAGVISVTALRGFLAERPQIALALLDLALFRLRAGDTRRLEFASAGSLARVSSRLIELVERFGATDADGNIDVALPITQEELASWSASSRESTARALRTLRELGVIDTRRRRLVVHDLPALRAHAPRL